jgi:hypothetical protein
LLSYSFNIKNAFQIINFFLARIENKIFTIEPKTDFNFFIPSHSCKFYGSWLSIPDAISRGAGTVLTK